MFRDNVTVKKGKQMKVGYKRVSSVEQKFDRQVIEGVEKVFEELVAPVNYRCRWLVICIGVVIFIFNIISLSGLTARES